MKSVKEMNDMNVIDAGVKSILDFGKDELVPHFIYCGEHYFFEEASKKMLEKMLEKMFLTKMEHYGVQFAIVTRLFMVRRNLVTKETVKKAYQGKLKNVETWNYYNGSIHDDLDKFFSNLQDRKKIKNEVVGSFFTPKLTEEELKLVEQRNEQHLSTYLEHLYGRNPDVNAEEMKKSDSPSKFVHGRCLRWTTLLTLESKRKQATDDDNPKTKKKRIIL